jgi:hypothetical protein
MKSMKKLILGLLMCALMAAPAVATITIISDPYYLTYGQDWTSQTWSFKTSPFTPGSLTATGIPADDGWINPGAPPSPTADVALTEGEVMTPPGWHDKLDASGHTGLIYGWDATIDLHIPNIVKPEPWYKIIQVEVVYHVEEYVPGQHGYIDASSYVTAGNDTYSSVDVKDIALDDGWRDVTIEWRIPQIYDSETIHLYFKDTGVAVDRIEVATVCVPEPATLLLLGGATLVGWLRRRRTL